MEQQWILDVEHRLRAIEVMCKGAHVSLWVCRGDSIEFVTGRTTSEESDLVERVWMKYRVDLREWRMVVEDPLTVIPLEAHVELTGLLVIGAPLPDDDIDRPYIDKVAQRLALLVSHRQAAARMPLTVKVAVTELVRGARGRRLTQEALLGLLERCEGRKTVLARWLGVTRQTVHNWCRHYGIKPRPRGAMAARTSRDL